MVPNFEVTARISLQTNYFIFLIFLSFWSHSKLAKISVFRRFRHFAIFSVKLKLKKLMRRSFEECGFIRNWSEFFWSQSESLCRRFAIGKILSFLAIIYPAYQRAIFINRKNKTSFIRKKNPYNNFHWYPTKNGILVKKTFWEWKKWFLKKVVFWWKSSFWYQNVIFEIKNVFGNEKVGFGTKKAVLV